MEKPSVLRRRGSSAITDTSREVESQWRVRLDKICRNPKVSANFLGVLLLQRAGENKEQNKDKQGSRTSIQLFFLLEQQRDKMGAAAES